MARTLPSPTLLWLQLLGSPAVLLLATAGMLLRLEPFATWYYPLAWWPFILLMDGLVCLRRGDSPLRRDPRAFLGLAALSVPVWLLFEVVNLAMENWYYVGSSHSRTARWVGYTICFATVLPGIMTAAELAGTFGRLASFPVRPIRVTARLRAGLWIGGLLCLALPVLLPRYGFPLIWLGVALLLEPFNHRWARRSLLRDWEQGSITTLAHLLLGGLLCGFAWEMFNIRALSKWIYTVPFFEELKLFEMPLAGFLGFPPFAVECFVLIQFLGIFHRGGRKALAPVVEWVAGVLVGIACLGTFHLLDLHTVNSLQPRIGDLREVAPREVALLQEAGVNRLDLWIERPGSRARETLALEVVGVSAQTLARWKQWAAMATLKGMGTGNLRLLMEAGVRSLKDLASQDAENLAPRLRAIQQVSGWGRQPPRDAQVRVWVREAKKMCEDRSDRRIPCE